MEAISRLSKALAPLSSPETEELGGGKWKKKNSVCVFLLSITATLIHGTILKTCFSMPSQGAGIGGIS